MKNKLIIGFIVVILLICLLPIPQKIDKTFYGINTQNGKKVDITLDMLSLKFLFLKDKLSGTITVKTETETFSYGEHLFYTGQSPSVNNASDNAHDFNGLYYNETMYMKTYEDGTVSNVPIGFEGVLVHTSSDFEKILILHNASDEIENHEDARYIGCVDKNQLEETKAYFSGYYD